MSGGLIGAACARLLSHEPAKHDGAHSQRSRRTLNWTALRFAVRRQRLELVLLSLVLLALIGLATWMALSISALGLGDCYVEPSRVADEECTRRFTELNQIAQAMPLLQAMAVFAPPPPPPPPGLFFCSSLPSRLSLYTPTLF